MEDSGYYSHRSSDFKLPSGSSGKISTAEDLFKLKYSDLESSQTYRYFRHGFRDEDDFEEFKQDLLDFKKLKREFQEDFSLSTFDELSRSCEVARNGRHQKKRDGLSRRRSRERGASETGCTTESERDDSRQRRTAVGELSQQDTTPVSYGEAAVVSGRSGELVGELFYPIPARPSREVSPSQAVGPRSDCWRRSGFRVSGSDFWNSKGARGSVNEFLSQAKVPASNLADRPDFLMEFFSGDEHFQEFERVFNTVHDRRSLRLSRDLDLGHHSDPLRGTDHRDGASSGRLSSRSSSSSSVFDDHVDLFNVPMDASFLDFFDNDEDFKEFEREFETFKFKRGSRVLEELKRAPSCDIFTDVKKFCDRNISSSDSHSQRRGEEDGDSGSECEEGGSNCKDGTMWKSVQEWDFVLNKLKRNSRIFTDPLGTSRSEEFTHASDGTLKKRKSWRDTWSGRDECNHAHKDDCQYTCHHHCLPSVALDCTTDSGGGEGNAEAPMPRGGGVSDLETSLSDTALSKRTPTRRGPALAPTPALPPTLLPRASTPELCRRPGSAQPVLNPLLDPPASTPGAAPEMSLCREVAAPTPASPPALDSVADSEKDETDSGYRSGTIPDDKLPKQPSQATLNREELRRRLEQFNDYLPGAVMELNEDGESFQGFIKVNLNLIRPITMSLSVQPPSFYELLTREHIVEQNTQSLSFYMPRDTVKSIHVQSTTTTREVVTLLLKKFHILDHPRKFAMYEQEVNRTKIVKLRRVKDKEFPLVSCLNWDTESPNRHRLVLQENETGEIQWDAFSLPELSNFLRVLDREQEESIAQLQHKYGVMKRIMLHRLKDLRKERKAAAAAAVAASTQASAS